MRSSLRGPYDFLHLYESPDVEAEFKMAAVIRSTGMVSSVETWPAISSSEAIGYGERHLEGGSESLGA